MFPKSLLITALVFSPAAGHAADGRTFIVGATEGYGVEDCLAEAGDCGKVVADALCEAHGKGPALSFGPFEGLINAISSKADERGRYIVKCAD